MARLLGSHTELLDNVAANHHFPLAVARGVWLQTGRVGARVRLIGGRIDQVGGIAFAIASREDYRLFMVDALAGMARVCEFRNGRSRVLGEVPYGVAIGNWYDLSVNMAVERIEGSINGEVVLVCSVDATLAGYVGLWTKSDATTHFDALTVTSSEQRIDLAL